MTVIKKDLGWNRIKSELRKADNSHTKVGFPSGSPVAPPFVKGSGHEVAGDMATVAEVAAFQEWGTRYIPARPFMSTSFNEAKESLKIGIANLYKDITEGKRTTLEALKIIGEFMASETKKKITDIRSPKLKDATIKRKGSSNPLIDIGQMRASVTHKEFIE